jgi:uncharacterized membrane protein
LRWLRGQLPALVSSGVITAESAAALERHYDSAEEGETNFGFVVLASVGAVLVGAGVVLLIAHNWDELSRTVRSMIAILPLLIALALMAFALIRRDNSRPWREVVAIFDVAAVATAISLISQTFQIQGTLAEFMQTWLLLSIPIVYLLRTTLGAVVYIIGCVTWLLAQQTWLGRPGNPNLFWVLLLLVAPYFAGCFRP